ncbi:MAG: 30S ribosome-binding factor RbfA [Phycisphaerales bacterium]
MSIRTQRLESAIMKGVQQVLARGLNDPRVRGLITVTSVRVTQDLAEAHIGISILPESAASLSFHGVESSAKHIRHELSQLVDTRQLPALRFFLDSSLKKQAEVLRAIDEAAGDLRKRRDEGKFKEPEPEEPAP